MNNVELMNVIGKIHKEMDAKGKQTGLCNLMGDNCIFSIYFLEEGKTIEGNEKILKLIKKIEKAFVVKGMSIGKTITMCIERVEE